MAYTVEEFKKLESKHGAYATWAIWKQSKDRTDERDVACIEAALSDLNSNYVFVGLNISSPVSIWGNFRGGKHDRKLKYALNNTSLRGSYMTDLFKNIVEPSSASFYKKVNGDSNLINENVQRFIEEMKDVKITSDSTFVILGTENSYTGKLFNKHFKQHFPNNKVVYHRHYSSRGTDKEWVESCWKTLNVNASFENVFNSYQ